MNDTVGHLLIGAFKMKNIIALSSLIALSNAFSSVLSDYQACSRSLPSYYASNNVSNEVRVILAFRTALPYFQLNANYNLSILQLGNGTDIVYPIASNGALLDSIPIASDNKTYHKSNCSATSETNWSEHISVSFDLLQSQGITS